MSAPTVKNPFTNAKLLGVGVDNDVYRRTGGERGSLDFVMSRSALSDFLDCPRKWRDGCESKDTNATRWGSIMDTLILSPEKAEDRIAIYPDTYPTETLKCPKCGSISDAKTCRSCAKMTERVPFTAEKPWNNNSTFAQEWKKKRAGKMFIFREKTEDDGTPDEDSKSATYGNALRARSRLMSDERLSSMIVGAQTQVMVMAEYRDRDTGIVVPYKVLLDIVPNKNHPVWGKSLADYKTARNASEKSFKEAIDDGFYDWQAVTYLDCYTAATGEDRVDFVFATQENTPPYHTEAWGISCDWLDDARREVVEALAFYCSCLKTGTWPGYNASVTVGSYGLLSREAYMLRNIPRPIKAQSTPAPEPAYDIGITP